MKKISIGNWITIGLVFGNLLFTAGIISENIETVQNDANMALKMAISNDKRVAVLESKIDQGFSNLEKLIVNGK